MVMVIAVIPIQIIIVVAITVILAVTAIAAMETVPLEHLLPRLPPRTWGLAKGPGLFPPWVLCKPIPVSR